MDSPTLSAALVKRLNLDFPILADETRSVTRAYGLHDAENDVAWPAVYIVGNNGLVVWRWVGTSYKKRPTVDDLLAALSKSVP